MHPLATTDDEDKTNTFAELVDVQQPTYLISQREFKARTTEDAEINAKLFPMCEALMTLSLNNNQSIILLNDLRVEGPKIFGWALLERPPCDVSKKLLAAYAAEAAAMSEASNAVRAADTKAVSLGKQTRLDVLNKVLAAVKGNCPEGVDAATWDTVLQVYALHGVLLDFYGPGDRAGLVPDIAPDVAALKCLPVFFDAVYAEISSLLRNADASSDTDVSVCDLWDGRFMHRLVITLCAADGKSLGIADVSCRVS